MAPVPRGRTILRGPAGAQCHVARRAGHDGSAGLRAGLRRPWPVVGRRERALEAACKRAHVGVVVLVGLVPQMGAELGVQAVARHWAAVDGADAGRAVVPGGLPRVAAGRRRRPGSPRAGAGRPRVRRRAATRWRRGVRRGGCCSPRSKPLHKPMDGLLVDREVKVGMWPGLLAMMVVEIVGLDAAEGSPRPSASRRPARWSGRSG